MRFEHKTPFGLLGEHLCLDVLRWQENLELKLNTGPGFEAGFGIRYHSATESEVVPDLDIVRYLFNNVRRRENAEVKTKKMPCAWNYGDPESAWDWNNLEIRTGMDTRYWHHYEWYAQKHFEEPLWIMFVHALPYIQLRNRKYTDTDQGPGIYICEITRLFSTVKYGAAYHASDMVYWNINDLTLFRSAKSLQKRPSTSALWTKIVEMARAQLEEENLIHVADLKPLGQEPNLREVHKWE
jgi:hypothetical protein